MAFQPTLPFGEDEAKEPSSSDDSLLAALARVCRESPLEEKIFVAPSLPAGHQIVERLARSGTAWVHLRVETAANLAHAAVGPELARERRRLISRAQALALVEQACAELLGPRSYFGALRDRPGLHRAIHATIDDLRSAGLSFADLPAAAFSNPRKRSELRSILRGYEAALERGPFSDRADVLRRAAAAVARDRPSPPPLYFVPENLELSVLERRFLERLAGKGLRTLAGGPKERWEATARRARLVSALGEENEVREVFRRVLAEGTPFEEVEILHTDRRTYPSLVYELSREHGIPCTFAEGIAASFTRPGRAALAFLDWIRTGFEADVLRHALSSGALALDGPGEGDPGTRAVSRALRDAGIGWGRDRHLRALERLERELETVRPESREDGDRTEAERERASRRRARRLEAARRARDFVAAALELAPASAEAAGDLSDLAAGTRRFVARFAREADELDGAARTALETLFREFEELAPLTATGGGAAARLRDAVADLAVASDRPRPGRVHVAHYERGGFSGRRRTFLIGLDENRHPGRDLEDPVLLDEERLRINEALKSKVLPLGRQRPTEAASALQACLARIEGELTASYSRYDVRRLSQASEPAPAPFLLEIHRRRSGRPEADYEDLAAALPAAAGFVPGPGAALDETEWWLARRESGMADPSAILALYPWLAQGDAAEAARAGDEFTIWDGRIAGGAPELDPRSNGTAFSASRVQALAQCPFAFFVKHVLGVESLAERGEEPGRWLNPLDRGTLLHEIFRDFFERITSAGEKPQRARHLEMLLRLADERLSEWRERIPPRSELAYSRDRDDVRFACRTLLRKEEEHCRDVSPRFFEVPFGRPREKRGGSGEIASAEPIEIALRAGRSFRLRGSIDRVDEAPDGSFHVWDYKTGSAFGIREGVGVRGGRQIQPALYALALETLLARAGRSGKVSRSGYFFPGRKGEGRRFALPLEPARARAVLDTLFDLVAAGMFPHASSTDDCRFCDLEPVCGGKKLAALRARAKLASSGDPALCAFREIHELPGGP